MKILVPVKRVLDHNVKVRVKTDQSGVDLANVRMAINPFDKIAVEEAVKLKENGIATEVVVVSIGPSQAQEILRAAMAMGADRGILLETDIPADLVLEPLAVAKALKAMVAREAPDLVIMGKQAIDDDSGQTGQMLSALLGWAQGTFASSIALPGDGTLRVTREVDGGLETLSLRLPAIVTADLRLNTPREVSLPSIIKARSKPLETITAEGLGVDLSPRLTLLRVSEPPVRKGGIKVESVDALIDKLRTEARVI